MKGTDGSYELSELLSGRGGSTDAVEEEVLTALQRVLGIIKSLKKGRELLDWPTKTAQLLFDRLKSSAATF